MAIKKSETQIMNEIINALSKNGVAIFRNQVGSYQLADGRWISSGLCKGSSDLIGWTKVKITPDMVGDDVAVFTAVEVKRPKAARAKIQTAFINAVNNAGGIAGYADSAEAALQLVFEGK